MQLHEKIKTIREDKKLSQSFIAFELGLDQSQYSRREKGEIDFTSKEILVLSEKLDTPVSKLFGEDATVFNNIDQKGGNFGQYITVSEKLIEQYEERIKEKEKQIIQQIDMIATLKQLLDKK